MSIFPHNIIANSLFVSEHNFKVTVFQHKKNWCLLSRIGANDNKVFIVIYRTPPENSAVIVVQL